MQKATSRAASGFVPDNLPGTTEIQSERSHQWLRVLASPSERCRRSDHYAGMGNLTHIIRRYLPGYN